MNRSNPTSIFRETNLTILYSFLNTLISIVFFGYAARKCDVSHFGLELAIISASGAIAGLFDFGTSYFYLRELSSGRIENNIVQGAFIGRTTVVIVCTTPLLIFGFVTSAIFLVEFAFLVNALMIVQFSTITERANGKTSILSRSLFFERSFSLLILIPLLNIVQNPPISLIIAGSTFLVIIIQQRTNTVTTSFQDIRKVIVWNPWRRSIAIGSTQLLPQIQQLDLNLLALLSNSSTAATYGAVARWTNALGIFAGGFSQSILPSASRERFQKSEMREVRKASVWLILAMVSSFIIFIFADNFVAIVLGAKFSESAGILKVLAVAAIASSFTQPIAAYLQAKGLNTAVFRALFIGILLQVATIILTHTNLGPYSAAYGYLLGQFAAATLLFASLINFKYTRKSKLDK